MDVESNCAIYPVLVTYLHFDMASTEQQFVHGMVRVSHLVTSTGISVLLMSFTGPLQL